MMIIAMFEHIAIEKAVCILLCSLYTTTISQSLPFYRESSQEKKIYK